MHHLFKAWGAAAAISKRCSLAFGTAKARGLAPMVPQVCTEIKTPPPPSVSLEEGQRLPRNRTVESVYCYSPAVFLCSCCRRKLRVLKEPKSGFLSIEYG
uniref:Uncharacterized protein n=1 Tax=Eutreptiella gymnastica TaxID=73025 RepID=A0A7S4GAK6_9EUGL